MNQAASHLASKREATERQGFWKAGEGSQKEKKAISGLGKRAVGEGRSLCGSSLHLPLGDGEDPCDRLPHWCQPENSWLVKTTFLGKVEDSVSSPSLMAWPGLSDSFWTCVIVFNIKVSKRRMFEGNTLREGYWQRWGSKINKKEWADERTDTKAPWWRQGHSLTSWGCARRLKVS